MRRPSASKYSRSQVSPSSGPGWPDADSFDRASYLAQQAAFHSRTHKQADDLSFIWYDHGTEILIDAGSYGFLGRTETGSDLWNKGFWYSDPKRIYVESTRSHNTVEIDGMSFNRKESPPYGSAIERWGETEDGLLFVETRATQFETIGHTRLLVFDPGNWLLVYDWLSDDAEAEHDYRQWFHFAPDLAVETQNGELRVSGKSLDPNLSVISLLPTPTSSEPVFGREEPDLLGWWSQKGGAFEPTTSVNFSVRQARSAAFATLFSFAEDTTPDFDYQRVDPSGHDARFRWTAQDGTHTLSFPPHRRQPDHRLPGRKPALSLPNEPALSLPKGRRVEGPVLSLSKGPVLSLSKEQRAESKEAKSGLRVQSPLLSPDRGVPLGSTVPKIMHEEH